MILLYHSLFSDFETTIVLTSRTYCTTLLC
nr:MAG TPA: hypothetical protein [Caudoviricetes sp.]